jgi:two-component system cell cycle sensor histidine kinase/response regulator CckA
VGQLAGGIAHDFNNILAAVLGMTEQLLDRHPPGDDEHDSLAEIRRNGLRAAGLVAQLLAFARRQPQRQQVLDLARLVMALRPLLEQLLGKGIDLEIDCDNLKSAVLADPGQVEQVIVNLAINARDAMVNHGRLRIAVCDVPAADIAAKGHRIIPRVDHVAIDVTDTGSGIPPEIAGKIFEPFFTTKPMGQGTGLGLSTVYGIVKQSEGWISVDSRPGQGAAFRIFLPVHVAAATAPAPPRPARPAARDLSGAGRILFVEDEDAVRSVAAKLLRARGYEVMEASSGEEALELAEAHAGEIDLMISDVVMPGMQGPELLKAAREYLAGAPVMFISGYAEAEFSNLLEGETNVSFLAKPIDIKTLAERVKQELQRTA